ncbi:MAG TPA: tetratricopeptide repeat protein [Casimicrobiaceae bacterium]|nr:tetratricopeptide repeat protein [Casimicrobiaceae bacterium]
MGVLERLKGAWRTRPEASQATDAPALDRQQRALQLIAAGNAHEDAGDCDAALRCYDAAVAVAPRLARAHLNRGNALLATQRLDDALAAYAAALQADPNYAAASFNMGNACVQLGRHEAALGHYRRAIALKPDFPQAELAMGNVLDDTGRQTEAVEHYERAIELAADYVEAHYNLGLSLKVAGRTAEAAASLRRAIELRPDYAEAHASLGSTLEDLRDLTGAQASYRRALELRPDAALVHSNLLLCLSHDDSVGRDALIAEHRAFGRRFEPQLRSQWRKHENSRDPQRPLHVGFVSPDLRDHAVAHFMAPILECLSADRTLVLHAYYNHASEGRATPRLRGYFQQWRTVAGLTDEALCDSIRADGIDVLIDLSGHTSENRLLVFARRAAPVQASWIGYPGTTGLETMDYYIADPHFLPPGDLDDQFTEKLVHLPANAPFLPEENAPEVNGLPATANGFITFGSFNRPTKITRSAVALWSRLLRELPDARMLLGAMPDESELGRLVEWFAAEAIARERLDFRPRCDLPAYLALHHEVDLCLDTTPYTGGTTTNHALWMGVPTLSLAGRTPASRQGAAILGHLGLQEFVADDAEAFVAKGVHWANHLAALAQLRSGLRARYTDSAIRRPDVIAQGFSAALRIMWQRWCAGLPPQTIDVSNAAALQAGAALD